MVPVKVSLGLPSPHLCRLVSACLTFMCPAPSRVIVHITDPMSNKMRCNGKCFENAHMSHINIRMIRTMSVASHNEQSKKETAHMKGLLNHFLYPMECFPPATLECACFLHM